MTALESEYRYLIRRAVRENKPDLAEQLRVWAFEKHDLDLIDYCKHPSTDQKTPLTLVSDSR